MRIILDEASRKDLINKNMQSKKGKIRYKKKNRSSIKRNVGNFNEIDMNNLFKKGIFEVNIPVKGETDNYVVKIKSVGFLDELHKQMKVYNGVFNNNTILKTLQACFDRNDVYIHCSCPDFCLEENTKIKLLNDEIVNVKTMLNMFKEGKDLRVFSADENGDMKPGKVTDVWISGYVNDMIRVVLDNGKEIITTPNHRYMLENGKYEEAQNLFIGQSLMPIHKIKSIDKIHYEKEIPVYDLTVEEYNNFYVDSGVVLHNCYRYAYWSTQKHYNSGVPQNSNGKKIRNPNDTLGAGCKHTMLALSNNSWLLPCTSVIYNYCTYMKKEKFQTYCDIIFPAIYEQEYDDYVQQDLFATGELDSIDNNDDVKAGQTHQGRDSGGKFTQGNKFGVDTRFKPKEKSNDEDEEDTLFDYANDKEN